MKKTVFRKLMTLLLALGLLLSGIFASCTPDGDASSSSSSQPPASSSQPPAPNPLGETLWTYQSNSYTPSGNNGMIKAENGGIETKTYRGLFEIQQFGELDYRFFFSNNVESTFEKGEDSYRNMETMPYKIVSAKIGTSTTPVATAAMSNVVTLTFDGSETKDVAAKEMYWSDVVSFCVESNEYLIFEWTVEYTMIPATMAEGVFSIAEGTGNGFSVTRGAPLPSLVGANRECAIRMAFVGDSITMGAGASVGTSWPTLISKELGTTVSTWNLGLGYARANDMVNSSAWLEKAKQNDIVVICFGVNDILNEAYGLGPRTAEQVMDDIATIAKACKDAGADVILCSTPPFAFGKPEKVEAWQNLVLMIEEHAETNGYKFFDIAACLGKPSDPSKPAYSIDGHPNAEGCGVVAEAFMDAGLIE